MSPNERAASEREGAGPAGASDDFTPGWVIALIAMFAAALILIEIL